MFANGLCVCVCWVNLCGRVCTTQWLNEHYHRRRALGGAYTSCVRMSACRFVFMSRCWNNSFERAHTQALASVKLCDYVSTWYHCTWHIHARIQRVGVNRQRKKTILYNNSASFFLFFVLCQYKSAGLPRTLSLKTDFISKVVWFDLKRSDTRCFAFVVRECEKLDHSSSNKGIILDHCWPIYYVWWVCAALWSELCALQSAEHNLAPLTSLQQRIHW